MADVAKGYWISAYRAITDPERTAAYARLAVLALEKAGGRFLARGGRQTVHESGVAERTVVVEFASYEAAVAAYESEEYRAALAALEGGAERDFRIIEGVAPAGTGTGGTDSAGTDSAGTDSGGTDSGGTDSDGTGSEGTG